MHIFSQRIATCWLLLATLLMANVAWAYDDGVATAQRQLNDLDYDAGEVDGQMGPATRGAIKDFQEDNELRRTGRLDTATKAKLTEKAEIQRKRKAARNRRNRSLGGMPYRYAGFSFNVTDTDEEFDSGQTFDLDVGAGLSGEGGITFGVKRNFFVRGSVGFHTASRDNSNSNLDLDYLFSILNAESGYIYRISDNFTLHGGAGLELINLQVSNDGGASEDDSIVGAYGVAGLRYRPLNWLELHADAQLGLTGRDGFGFDAGIEFLLGRKWAIFIDYEMAKYEDFDIFTSETAYENSTIAIGARIWIGK